jgi:uncharacterized protein (TIGR00255 family)
MIRSMTGYSRLQSEDKDAALAVTVKSTNHRFLDLQLRVSAGLESLEPLLRRLVKEQVARGHIEVTVSRQRLGQAPIQLDDRLLAAYVAACQKLRDTYGFSGASDPVALLRIPGIVATGDGEIAPAELERLGGLLEKLTVTALEHLNEMRSREGEILGRDLRQRLGSLQNLANEVSQLARRVPALYQRRLESRIQEMLHGGELDAARLAQEVAYLAARSDITEELTRFQSHLEQVRHLLEEGVELGKKLDFLLQEMNREANTMLSKTTDVPEVGLEIARQAIEMKTEIEKLREQAQNIE